MRKEVKIYLPNLNVGKNDYVELHNNILSSKTLLDIKRLFDEFNKKYNIDRNTFFQGVTVLENFIYYIIHKNSGRKYVGKTTNLISRFYSYITFDISSSSLKKDIIDFGISEFEVKFIESDDIDIDEILHIQNNSDNCYNIIHAGKERKFKPKQKYNIGGFSFNSKKEIKEFCRKTIDTFMPGTIIPIDNKYYNFAIDMIKLHPGYDRFLETGSDIILSIINDNEADARGIGQWKIFCFEYKTKRGRSKKWGFSTNKIINNL